MSEPIFQVGDEVEFDYNLDYRVPRWNCNTENKSGNIIVIKGKVSHICKTYLNVEYVDPDGDIMFWSWPTKDSMLYSPDQWNKPGFLRKTGCKVEVKSVNHYGGHTNQGLSRCMACCQPTRTIDNGFTLDGYQICANRNCDMFER